MVARLALASSILILVGGCTFEEATPEQVQVLCKETAHCPAGLLCVLEVGLCVSPDHPCVVREGDDAAWAPDGNECEVDGICMSGACVAPRCGDGVVTVSAGEACDDGNDVDTDACTTSCTVARCGDGIVHHALEACDDGNGVDTDGCRNSCGLPSCGDGIVQEGVEACDDGNAEARDGCLPSCLANVCGDGIQNLLAEGCDDGNGEDADDCLSTCVPNVCGDGVLNPGREACDDGNDIDGDGCDDGCRVSACGNGVLAGDEICDDGNLTSGDGCDANCTVTACGNGVVSGSEVCDDGNAVDGDGCDTNCRPTACGNGVVAGTETCDDGNLVSGDGCDVNCTATACGNGVVTGAEICDDGNAVDGDGCDSNCRPTACGNGVVAGAEVCDDGNLSSGDGCDANCTVTACGNGVVTGTEACDDGNLVSGDGCDANCTVTTCGNGVVSPDEECDDANDVDNDGCTNACTLPVCGDRIVQAGEECDDGNTLDTDGCHGCLQDVCGDGVIFAAAEVCDDGNTASGDGCRGDCRKVEVCGDAVVDADEPCDDGNLNPADGCDACVATTWAALTRIGGSAAGTEVGLSQASNVAMDRHGNLFVTDSPGQRVYRLDASTGAAIVVAGTGVNAYNGDDQLATGASLRNPVGFAVDGLGNLFIGEAARIRRIDAQTGMISTLAGNGTSSTSGDGGPAATATLQTATGIAVDGLGNLYFADDSAHRVRRIDARTGIITTVAGTGTAGYNGDGIPAASAQLDRPLRVALDPAGNLYIADRQNERVRRVDATTQVITTVAGDPAASGWNDGGPATAARLGVTEGVTVDSAGNLYISANQRVRFVDASTQIISLVAGSGTVDADGVPATSVLLSSIHQVAVDPAGNFYIAFNERLGRVDAATGVIDTVLGTLAYSGEGRFATATPAPVLDPSLTITPDGDLYFAPANEYLLRRIDGTTGVLTTVAGTGKRGFSGDGGPATDAELGQVSSLVSDASGNVYVGDGNTGRIRRIDAATGVIDTYVTVPMPNGLALDAAGNLYVARTLDRRVARVDALTQAVTTVAGTGSYGYTGDGGPATAARLGTIRDVAVDADGNLFISDEGYHVVRRVDPATGNISTYAGTGTAGFLGDGIAATSSNLNWPNGLAVDAQGHLYIGDSFNQRVRRVDAVSGLISSVTAGSGSFQDGGPSTASRVMGPRDVALDAGGNLFISEYNFQRIRRVDAATGIITTVAGVVAPYGVGPLVGARLASPVDLAVAPDKTLFAAGGTGTVEAAFTDTATLEVVAGRYPQISATSNLALYRSQTFGSVGGVAWDEDNQILYLSETSNHRIQAVTAVDSRDTTTWTVLPLANAAGAAGFADGPASGARFREPQGLFVDSAAQLLYVADTGNHAIRVIDLSADTVTTIAGTPQTLGFFGDGLPANQALLYRPASVTRCRNGDLFIADQGNNRVRRVEATSDLVSTVLGDGAAASSGQGSPAWAFSVDTPRGLGCDSFGNLYITSRTSIRLVLADDTGVVDGSGAVQTIFGAAPRTTYPATVSECLSGLVVLPTDQVQVTEACAGLLIELERAALP
ncbi:MAG: DUF4215 domain-containing protein [Deltaproteobacteria bacterium]|nr:DUF4215 domain-containing protein [Deltaproteobacteria bacterium]